MASIKGLGVWSAGRLEQLQRELSERELDAYIIPRFDAHQGEYCAPHDARLAWVSGFTGSAGLAIVTRSQAILFVDGRYTVQVKEETSSAHFSYEHLFDNPLEHWLAKHAAAGWSIGYDPMLLPTSWVRRFEMGAQQARAVLAPIADNLIDKLWHDQPAAPMAAIDRVSEQLSGEASGNKRKRIGRLLAEKGCDWLVETQPDNIAWLLNVRGGDVAYNPMPHSFALLDQHGHLSWFVAPEKFPAGSDELGLSDVDFYSASSFLPVLQELVQNGDHVLIDPDFAPFAAVLAAENSGASVTLERGPVTLAKAIKNPVELEGAAYAAKIDSVAWIETLAWLDQQVVARARAGDPITEMEVAAYILERRSRIEGFLEPSFETIAASDANGAMCHYSASEASNTPLNVDSVFLLDSGGQYLFGTTDATRTMCFAPVSSEVRKAYTLVLKGHIQFALLGFPDGTQGHHIDAIARQALWQHGMDYDHGTGHGVGHRLSVHEGPQKIAKPYSPYDLKPGMIVTNEPGYYKAGEFGIRIENLIDIVRLDNGFMGFRDLTLVPIQRTMIDVDMMTERELNWLNDYHARVWSEMEANFEGSIKDWLQANTCPITK